MCPYCLHPIDDHDRNRRCTVKGCQFCPVIIYPGRSAPRQASPEEGDAENRASGPLG
jgi:hypothetical protein